MKNIGILILGLILFSCTTKRIIELPESDFTMINEVMDVSAAYVFYDTTKIDKVDFNRKNLIGTTNWLVNVDKRLTLDQLLPSVIILQNKRHKTGMHKNDAAKNYFTCNDKRIGNLGFIEFTNIEFHLGQTEEDYVQTIGENVHTLKFIKDDIVFDGTSVGSVADLPDLIDKNHDSIVLSFDSNLSFQDYISYKSDIIRILTPYIAIDSNEFIY